MARRLAAAMAMPGVDSNLDCEQGIMKALVERNHEATDIPIELLREWTLVAVRRRDCGLLARAMTLASAAGHSMGGLLGSFGSVSTLLSEITALFHETNDTGLGSGDGNSSGHSSGNGSGTYNYHSGGGDGSGNAYYTNSSGDSYHSGSNSGDRSIPGATSSTSDSNPALRQGAPFSLLFMGVAGAGSLSGLPPLPASMCWLHDHSSGAQLGLVKHVVNGVATFFSNKAFEAYVLSREILQASWQAQGRPSTELFIHPDDVFKVCSHVGRLWKGLALTMVCNEMIPGLAAAAERGGSGSFPLSLDTVKECAREVHDVVRLWVTWPRRGYVQCRARVHLVVTVNPQGQQSSHLAFGFRALAPSESSSSSDTGHHYHHYPHSSSSYARASQASPTEEAGMGMDVRAVGGGGVGGSGGGAASSSSSGVHPSMASPRTGLPDAFAFGAAMAAASRSSSLPAASLSSSVADGTAYDAASASAAEAAAALSSLSSSFSAPSGVTFADLPASQSDASTPMANMHSLRSGSEPSSFSSSFASSSSSPSNTSSALAVLRARLAPLDTNAPAGCVTSSVDWGSIGANGSFVVNGGFVVPGTADNDEGAVNDEGANNQTTTHQGPSGGSEGGAPASRAFPSPTNLREGAGLPISTPPANGAQFFSGEGEEFWDAVTILAKD